MPVGFPDYYGGLTLPVTVPEGGTGQTSLALHGVPIGQGTSGVLVASPGAAGQVLMSNGASADPSFQVISIDTGATVVVAKRNQQTLLASISPTTLNTPVQPTAYRISAEVYLNNGSGLLMTLTVAVIFTYRGGVNTITFLTTNRSGGGALLAQADYFIHADVSTVVQFSTTYGSGGSGDYYDLHLRLEAVGTD